MEDTSLGVSGVLVMPTSGGPRISSNIASDHGLKSKRNFARNHRRSGTNIHQPFKSSFNQLTPRRHNLLSYSIGSSITPANPQGDDFDTW